MNIHILMDLVLNYKAKDQDRQEIHKLDIFLCSVSETYQDVEEIAKLLKQNIEIKIKGIEIKE